MLVDLSFVRVGGRFGSEWLGESQWMRVWCAQTDLLSIGRRGDAVTAFFVEFWSSRAALTNFTSRDLFWHNRIAN